MFITFEGIDGSGKSTLIAAISARLAGRAHVVTREPTDLSPWGRRLRASASEGRLGRAEEIDHFHRDRLHHLETVIRPALARGEIVLCDRYVDSTLAYQADDPEAAAALLKGMRADLLMPDLTFILDLSVETALERIGAQRARATSFEARQTLERAARIYLSLREARHVHIDAARQPGEVEADVWSRIENRLASR